MHDKEWNYTINRTDDQKNGQKKENNFRGERYKGKEVFILNYDSSTIVPKKPIQLAMGNGFLNPLQ